MNILILVNNATLYATLEDNLASREFAEQLPLELTLSDYNGTEKIADLPVRLSIDGAPQGIEPKIGDIAYFAPWGNLALFYQDFDYSSGLIRLGRIEGGIENLGGDGEIEVRIERADEAS